MEEKAYPGGYETLCIAVFEQAKEDYFRYRSRLEDPGSSDQMRTAARIAMKSLRDRFESGRMDRFTDVFQSKDSMDIWADIRESYEKAHASEEQAAV